MISKYYEIILHFSSAHKYEYMLIIVSKLWFINKNLLIIVSILKVTIKNAEN